MHNFDIIVMIILIVTITTFIFMIFKKQFIDDSLDIKVKKILSNSDNESFIVSDAQDFHNYNKLRDEIKAEPNEFTDAFQKMKEKDNEPVNKLIEEKKEKMKEQTDFSIQLTYNKSTKPNPLTDINKKHPRSFVTAADYGWDAPFPTVSCSNSSIDDRYRTGPKKIIPNHISCGHPDSLTAENYYRTHFEAPVAYLEDYRVRGWNYNQFSDFPHPTKSNIRILSQNTKGLPPKETQYNNIPIGWNYAFHNTPAMNLP